MPHRWGFVLPRRITALVSPVQFIGDVRLTLTPASTTIQGGRTAKAAVYANKRLADLRQPNPVSARETFVIRS
jgi:hypothetical protein